MDSLRYKVSERSIEEFARISGDNAPFHTAREVAKGKGFDDIIAHGVLLLNPVSKILGNIYPGTGYVILQMSSKFHSPAYPDDELVYKWLSKGASSSVGTVSVEIKAYCGDRLVLTCSALCKNML
jgi:acyl dehydratase